jgi:hypothetical protein
LLQRAAAGALASALQLLSLPKDGTAAAILALEYGGLRCVAAAFYPHLINFSPPVKEAPDQSESLGWI